MNKTDKEINRPTSPHVQIYKMPFTGILSISHRISGVLLVYGIFMLLWLLVAVASGEDEYNYFMEFCSSKIGLIMLFGWSFALYFHMCNGIRHLIWDTGRMFKKSDAIKSGYLALFIAIAMTIATWHCALN